MTPKKARDNRRLRREQRQNPPQPPSQPQPTSTSLSPSPSPSPSAPEARPTNRDTRIAQFFLSELIQALQHLSSNPSTNMIISNPSRRSTTTSTLRCRSAASSAALIAALTAALASESSLSAAFDALLSAIHDVNPNLSRSPTQPSSSTSAASEASAELGRLLASVLDNNTPIVSDHPVDVQETRSWNIRGSNSVDDIISEPSTSDNNSTIATRSSNSRSRTLPNYKQTKNSNKNRKALWAKFRKVLESSITQKEKQEEVASLTEFCLRHIAELNVNTTTDNDNQAGGGPSPAGPDGVGATDEDGEGSADA